MFLHMTMCGYSDAIFSDPEYEDSEDSSDEDEDEEDERSKSGHKAVSKVDVDIYLTAFANARKYYDQKRATAAKHEKTIAASEKVSQREGNSFGCV